MNSVLMITQDIQISVDVKFEICLAGLKRMLRNKLKT